MGNTLSPVINNIFIEHFEKIALNTADHNPINGSDMSKTRSWFGHMDRQNCRHYFRT